MKLPSKKSYAVVTLLSSDAYRPGAITLAHALRALHTHPESDRDLTTADFDIICLLAGIGRDGDTTKSLRRAYDYVVHVEPLAPHGPSLHHISGRPTLATALSKLHAFRLTQYKKVIYLDADTLPIKPISHLFTEPYSFAAVPDIGWPDIFNTGLMLLTPNDRAYTDLVTMLSEQGTWDGADQGLLNEWRGEDWHRLSFVYNTTPSGIYTYAPAYKRFGSDIKVLHFLGPNKPWHQFSPRFPRALHENNSDPTSSSRRFVQLWWEMYHSALADKRSPASIPGGKMTRNRVPVEKQIQNVESSDDSSDTIEPMGPADIHEPVPQTQQSKPKDFLKKGFLNAWDENPSIIKYSARLRTAYKNLPEV